MRNLLGSLEEGIGRLSLLLGGLCLLLMLALIFVEATARYIFNFSFGLSEEFSGYLLVALIFLGLAFTARTTQGHIRVTVVIDQLPPSIALRLRPVTLLFFLFFSAVMAKFAYDYTIVNYVYQTKSFYMWVTPQWPVIMPMAIGFFLLALVLIFRFRATIRKIRGGS